MQRKHMGFLGLIATLLLATSAKAAPVNIVVDFDNDAMGNPILAGQIIDTEYQPWGLTISTVNHAKSFNYGIAFDSLNPTGDDGDLRTGPGTPHDPMGMVLIISERDKFNSAGRIAVPDDEAARPAGYFDFIFDRVNQGGYVSLLDIEKEEAGNVQLFLDNNLVNTFAMAGLGDNSFQTIDFGTFAFDHVRVNMGGSGAVTALAANAIPEPASLGLLALGGLTLLARRRRPATN